MPALHDNVDPDGLLEYSVVFTDRSLNHMSQNFQGVMRELSAGLRQVYNGAELVLVPGGGTYAMEAVARQFATAQPTLIVRNGWFSYRWTQIIEACQLGGDSTVLAAKQTESATQAPFAPAPIDQVVAAIQSKRPRVVFAPHVETSAGIRLPDDYVTQVGAAARSVDALFVLDCVASGALWVDMVAANVDVLISAPQKGWSASPCAGIVLLNERAAARLAETQSNSFACDLKQWRQIMLAYESGGHAYHATLPTDGLRKFHGAMQEMESFGFSAAKDAQETLGREVREMLAARGFGSVAAPGFEAPGVVVSYTDDPAIKSGQKFAAAGLQIAAGVPLMCDEPDGFSTFRIGLFGLDKLINIERTVANLTAAVDAVRAA